MNETITKPEIVEEEVTEEVTNAETEVNQTEGEQEPFLKIKYNKEEQSLSHEEAVELAQKGRNYDHIKGELENLKGHQGLKYLQKTAEKNAMSVEELVSYLEEQEELTQAKAEAEQYGVENDAYIKKQVHLRKDAEAWRQFQVDKQAQEEKVKADKDRKERDNAEFLDFFKKEYGRNVDLDKDVPNEVLEIAEKQSKPLKDAFIEYKYKELTTQINTQAKNDKNAQSSTGSVSSDGVTDSDFISFEQFEKNKGNRSWVVNNLGKIMKSKTNWKTD